MVKNMDEWYQIARNSLKSELAARGLGYADLVIKLRQIGVEESYHGLANKINRGAYTHAFFLQCMHAMDNTDQIDIIKLPAHTRKNNKQ